MATQHHALQITKSSCSNEILPNLISHSKMKEFEFEEEEEEEALSLCDLPTIDNSEKPRGIQSRKSIEPQEEFNFFSTGRDSLFDESELCTADEVFFQGQILPMRHSVSSEKCYTQFSTDITRNFNQIICNSSLESIDHCSSGGFTGGSSRSSSIGSHHSSSSSSNSTSTTSAYRNKIPKTRVLNQFQFSHPSPKPQIQLSSNGKNSKISNPNSRSPLWSLFRVGLVSTPEIGLHDLKLRTNSSRSSSIKSLDSRHSNSNDNSNGIMTDNERKKQRSFFNKTGNSNDNSNGVKKQPFLFNKTGVLFGSCRCSASAIGTINSRIEVMRRSESFKEECHVSEEKQQRAGKQALSRNRTFEWLKQLSLETATDQV